MTTLSWGSIVCAHSKHTILPSFRCCHISTTSPVWAVQYPTYYVWHRILRINWRFRTATILPLVIRHFGPATQRHPPILQSFRNSFTSQIIQSSYKSESKRVGHGFSSWNVTPSVLWVVGRSSSFSLAAQVILKHFVHRTVSSFPSKCQTESEKERKRTESQRYPILFSLFEFWSCIFPCLMLFLNHRSSFRVFSIVSNIFCQVILSVDAASVFFFV